MKTGSGFCRITFRAAALVWVLTSLPANATIRPAVFASSYVTITSPSAGATVHGTITIATAESSNVGWINVLVDNVWLASNPPTALPPYSVAWNSTTVADGNHTISVTGYDSRNALIASAAVAVSVLNHPPTPTPTPRPSASPTLKPVASPSPSATAYVIVTSPVSGATVHGTITVATSKSASVSWVSFNCDNVWFASNPSAASPPYSVPWNSTSVANGSHTLSVNGYNSSNVVVATTRITVYVQNLLATSTASPRPTARPKPSASCSPKTTFAPTLCPTPSAVATSYPLSDSAAAAKVVLNPGFEPRPQNYPANTSVPSAGELALMGSLSFLDSHGNYLLSNVTGDYKGTTDEIVQWASYKWGFDPDIVRATTVTETHWYQYDIGDITNGVSLGILQIKSRDYAGTCNPVSLKGYNTGYVTDPSCLSYNYTGFAADYKLAYQRACIDGSIGYLYSQTPTAGYPTYANATGDQRLWGCIGNWYSGNWYDSEAISYIEDVKNNLAAKPWLQPGF
jgi:autotransporter family porin